MFRTQVHWSGGEWRLSTLDIRGEVDFFRQFRDIHLESLLDRVQGLRVCLVRDECDGQTLHSRKESCVLEEHQHKTAKKEFRPLAPLSPPAFTSNRICLCLFMFILLSCYKCCPVLRIHDILGGSGSADPFLWLMDPDSDPDPGSGSFYFRHWPSRCQQKTNLTKFFLLMTIWSYIYIIFQR